MGGGGKGGTTVQKTEIPPEVMARYNAVNARAEQVAAKPFQRYEGQFVAPLTGTQTGAIQNITNTQGTVAPFYGVGAGLTMAGAEGVGPLTRRDIAYYESPYTEAVAAPTYAALRQQQGQELAQQQANAIRSGAAFGQRSGLERANLMRQQALGTAQAMAPIYQQGYTTALQTAAGQQGVLTQDQARRLAAGQQMAALGTGLQGAQLQQAQAQLAAGTAEQQTQQADLTARYQQFLQERGYDFQTAQFLANIAMGTGALSGSTTTTTAPMPFFSDRRLKKDVEKIGHTKDDLPVYEFRYKGEEERGEPHVGFMAQDVEKKYPDAVGLAGGYKTVDYNKVAQHQDEKGLGAAMDRNWMGGAVYDGSGERQHFVGGGPVSQFRPDEFKAILEMQQQSFGPFAQGGIYGQKPGQTPFSNTPSVVPKPTLAVARLQPHAAPPRMPEGVGAQVIGGLNAINKIDESVTGLSKVGRKVGEATGLVKPENAGQIAQEGNKGTPSAGSPPAAPVPVKEVKVESASNALNGEELPVMYGNSGGVVPQRRSHYSVGGGGINPYDPTKDPSTAIQDIVDDGSMSPQELAEKQKRMSGPSGGAGGGGGGGGLLGAASTIGSLYGAAKGIGALASLLPFSDERLKDNIRPVGKTFDGQNIYAYHMGDGQTQLGLMAQEVMHRKPEAVGERKGFLTLDYDKATEDATPREGGVMPRHGAQEGGRQEGGMSEEEFNRTLARAAEITRLKESGKREGNYQIAGEVIPSGPYAGDRAYGAYQVMGKNIGPWTEQYLGRRMTPEEFRNDKQAQDDLFNAVWGGNLRKYGNVPDAVSIWASGQPLSGNRSRDLVSGVPTSSYVANFMKLYDPNSPLASAQESGGVRPPRNIPDEGGRGERKPEGGIKGFWSENKGTILPILAGLGSMAQSRSPFLAGAILEGIGGGARAYADINQQLAATDLTREQAETQSTVSLANMQQIAQRAIYKDAAGNVRVMTEDGNDPLYGEWMQAGPGAPKPVGRGEFMRKMNTMPQYRTATDVSGEGGIRGPEGPKAPGMETKAPQGLPEPQEPTGQFNLLGDAARKQAQQDYRRVMSGGDKIQPQIAISNKVEAEVTSKAEAARQNGDTLNQATALVLSLPEAGLSAPGATAGLRQQWLRFSNDLINQVPEYVFKAAGVNRKDYLIKPEELGTMGAYDKIMAVRQFATVQNAGERSLGALDTAARVVPALNLSRGEIINIMAGQYRDKQIALDQERYLNDYKNLYSTRGGTEGAYLAQNAMRTFRTDMSALKYQREEEAFKKLLQQPGFAQVILKSGQFSPEFFDQYAKEKLNAPMIRRWITND